MPSLLLATRNSGKVREIARILEDAGWSLCSLREFEHVETPEENGETYADNAIAKARFYAAAGATSGHDSDDPFHHFTPPTIDFFLPRLA